MGVLCFFSACFWGAVCCDSCFSWIGACCDFVNAGKKKLVCFGLRTFKVCFLQYGGVACCLFKCRVLGVFPDSSLFFRMNSVGYCWYGRGFLYCVGLNLWILALFGMMMRASLNVSVVLFRAAFCPFWKKESGLFVMVDIKSLQKWNNLIFRCNYIMKICVLYFKIYYLCSAIGGEMVLLLLRSEF